MSRFGSVTWPRNPATGKLDLNYIPLPAPPTDHYVLAPFASVRPLEAYYPRIGEVQATTRHAFNTTYPSAHYRSLVQCSGGSPPYRYELINAPAGMTIGEFLVEDANGDLFPDEDYGVLDWPSASEGTFRIVVRVTDQADDSVVFDWDLKSDLSLNFFAAPDNIGTGSGADTANAKAFSGVYLGATTNSPVKGKVLRLLGGSYTGAPALYIDTAYQPAAWSAVTGQEPIFSDKASIGSDVVFEGLTFSAVGTSDFGVVNLIGGSKRQLVFNCKFDSCFNEVPAEANNQCCIGANLSDNGGITRDFVAIVGCHFKDSNLIAAFDFYSVQSLVAERNIFTYDESITSQTKADIFPKSSCYEVQIAYNVWDNPHLPAPVDGIVQIHNAIPPKAQLTYTSDCFYNYVRCASGNAVRLNSSSSSGIVTQNGLVVVTARCERNTIVNGNLSCNNWDRSDPASAKERISIFKDNVIQNPSAGVTIPSSPTNDPQWFFYSGDECEGTSGVVSADMKLTESFITYLGLRGAQIRRA